MSTKHPLKGSVGFCSISLYLGVKRRKKKRGREREKAVVSRG
jgi:hypothetical protein